MSIDCGTLSTSKPRGHKLYSFAVRQLRVEGIHNVRIIYIPNMIMLDKSTTPLSLIGARRSSGQHEPAKVVIYMYITLYLRVMDSAEICITTSGIKQCEHTSM